jgi:hypothetical protein
VLEGVCFALRDSLGILQALGLAPRQLLLTGGGARSPFVRRLQAEVYGLPVCTVNREEGPAYGAALLAAVGAGAFPDLAAAAAAFRVEQPQLKRLLGFGLCDGASALALHGQAAGLDGYVLVNPWFVEAEAGEPPAAAIKARYREQLLSLEGWKRLLSGSISYRKLFKGLRKIVASGPSTLAGEIAAALGRSGARSQLILATRDATAIAAEAEWTSSAFRAVRAANPAPLTIDSDSHTFSRPGDEAALLAAVRVALERP